MTDDISVKPLPRKSRQRTFLFLVLIFLCVIPILYLTATGYRLDFRKPTNLVSTGGISITINEPQAELYLDDVEVRTVRTFRKSFYAQGIDEGTHRLHVQKDGYHTWVKELPVSERLVTEAVAFNLPLVPQVRLITRFETATGTPVVLRPLLTASTSEQYIATTTSNPERLFVLNDEFTFRSQLFAITSTSTDETTLSTRVRDFLTTNATTSTSTLASVEDTHATTTIVSGNVRLYESGDQIYATWIGPHSEMPYYYCSPEFARYSTSTDEAVESVIDTETESQALLRESVAMAEQDEDVTLVIHPVQTVADDMPCDPTIRIDRKWWTVTDFDFFPLSTDFVLLATDDGVYVVEIDDRSWQNTQPLIMGTNIRMAVENGEVYVYDGHHIYQVLAKLE